LILSVETRNGPVPVHERVGKPSPRALKRGVDWHRTIQPGDRLVMIDVEASPAEAWEGEAPFAIAYGTATERPLHGGVTASDPQSDDNEMWPMATVFARVSDEMWSTLRAHRWPPTSDSAVRVISALNPEIKITADQRAFYRPSH
jgi:hypothetical protein